MLTPHADSSCGLLMGHFVSPSEGEAHLDYQGVACVCVRMSTRVSETKPEAQSNLIIVLYIYT